jgi:hypothetical protein
LITVTRSDGADAIDEVDVARSAAIHDVEQIDGVSRLPL